jgi:hypothetical protein
MESIDDYIKRFKDELDTGLELDKVLEQAAEMLVLRDKVIRDKQQTILIYKEWQSEGKNQSSIRVRQK